MWYYIVISALVSIIFILLGQNLSLKEQLKATTFQKSLTPEQLAEIEQEIIQLVKEEKVIEAVKRTRETYGYSLIEAKQFVDRIKEKAK